MGAIDFANAASLANATPAGAAASILSAAASTPASSQSGDIKSGLKNFGNTIGGVMIGNQGLSPWVLIAGAAVLGYLFFKLRK